MSSIRLNDLIRELYLELKRIDEAILALQQMAVDKPRRGRRPKYESELARRLQRRASRA